jgi:hypothetical protein
VQAQEGFGCRSRARIEIAAGSVEARIVDFEDA